MSNLFKKNTMVIVSGIFMIVGLPFLLIAIFILVSTFNFVKNAGHAVGVVDAINRSTDSDGDTLYAPQIIFTVENGISVSFDSPIRSSSTFYKVGDEVQVLYNKEKPQDAKIDSLFELWFMPGLFGLFGVVFPGVSGLLLYKEYKRKQLQEELRVRGTKIQTDFSSIKNGNIRVNNQYSYIIVSQWQNPKDNLLYTFESDDIWFDPTSYVTNKKLEVLINPDNPKEYYMDISFLPTTA